MAPSLILDKLSKLGSPVMMVHCPSCRLPAAVPKQGREPRRVRERFAR